jgi:glycosyltransferase involved in cell wall biosynthesis
VPTGKTKPLTKAGGAMRVPQNQIDLSIVVPALNEEDNVGPLVDEVKSAVLDKGISCELIVVDDGSTDQTLPRLLELAKTRPWLRILHRPKAKGQSAAMQAGIQAARGLNIATLDADLQNDPADLPEMLKKVQAGECDMVQGTRAHRQDTPVRKVTSWVGRTARSLALGDIVRDTGCTTRVVRAEFAKQYLLQFKGMHRFMPVYAKMLGAKVVEAPVNHRPRVAGVAKYGVMNRAFVGFVDLFAMRWMISRYKPWATTEVTPGAAESTGAGNTPEYTQKNAVGDRA